MGLRTKFNLMLLVVALFGIALFGLASTPVLDGLAKDEVLQTSRIMMASAAGAETVPAGLEATQESCRVPAWPALKVTWAVPVPAVRVPPAMVQSKVMPGWSGTEAV